MSGYKSGSNYQDQGGNAWYVNGTLQVNNGATVYFGEDDNGVDQKWFGATSGKYMLWDESADQLKLVSSFDITGNSQFTGTITVGTNGTGHDVTIYGDTSGKYIKWTQATDLLEVKGGVSITGNTTFGVDGTGVDVTFYGDTSGKYASWDQANDKMIVNGVLQLGSTATAALYMGGGTSATKLTTSTADKNFIATYTQSTATSGDSRGAYIRHYLGGTIATTGYGDAIRAFATVTGTGYSFASGVHATMQINTGATITGSGAGLRATLAAEAESRTLTGALAALQVDGDIGANNTVPTRCSLIRLAKAGTIDIPYFLDISDDQCLKGDGTIAASPSDALKVIMPNGDVKYIPLHAIS